jgi:hypothetical protein
LDDLLGRDLRAYGYAVTGWGVPAPHAAAIRADYRLGAHTLRRAVWRLG